MNGELRREWSLRDLVLFHVTAVVSVRWISLAAARGPSSLSLWGLSFLVFFLPGAWVVLDLSRRMPEQGGLYRWTKEAFGPFHGFVCAWSYVVSNLVYFPALLTFVADVVATVVLGPEASASPTFVTVFTIGTIWAITGLNVAGVRFGRWVQIVGALSIFAPCGLLVACAAVLALRRGPTLGNLLPEFTRLDTWRTWSSICFAMAGLELASTMGGEVRDPLRSLPRSVVLAGVAVVSIYTLGTLASILAAGTGSLSETRGILQALERGFAGLGLLAPVSLLALLLALGGLGNFGAWLAGSGRMPQAVGVDRYLPSSLARIHPRFGSPHVSLLWQAGISSGIALLANAGSTVGEAYGVLNDATTVLYFIPYLYLFAAHFRRVQGGPASRVPASLGFLSTLLAVAL
ncbi:MAG TPA: APC family permease, partial [Planctomycetota bacterium]|nr:APC family permease [Planctomycetota bacterium]